MELKVVGEPDEEMVKVVPSIEGGSLLIELNEDDYADLAGIASRNLGKIGTLHMAVSEITLIDVDKQEYPAIKNGNAYLKRQLVRPQDELGRYSLRGEVTINLDGSPEPRTIDIYEFQEVGPVAEVNTTYSQSALPENIQEYTGKWVAIRGREVVIAANEYDDVVHSAEFQATDALYRVPPHGSFFLSHTS